MTEKERTGEGEEQGLGRGPGRLGSVLRGCRSTLPPPQLSSLPKHTNYTLWDTSLSSPSLPQRNQVDRDAGKKQPPPPLLAFGPLLGTGVGKKGRRLRSGKPCPSLLPQSLCLSLSSCLSSLVQTELLPADRGIAPLLQTHSAMPRVHLSLGTSPALLLHPQPTSLPPLLHTH